MICERLGVYPAQGRQLSVEEVFNLDYDPVDYLAANEVLDEEGKRITTQLEFGEFLKKHWNIKAKESCATCHR